MPLTQGNVQYVDQYLATAQAEPSIQTDVNAELYYLRGRLQEANINYFDALSHYDQAIRLMPENELYLTRIAKLSQTMSLHDKALAYYEKVLHLLCLRLGDKHEQVATNYHNIGSIAQAKEDHKLALEYHARGLALRLSLFGEKNPHVASSYDDLGQTLLAVGLADKAIESLQRGSIPESSYFLTTIWMLLKATPIWGTLT